MGFGKGVNLSHRRIVTFLDVLYVIFYYSQQNIKMLKPDEKADLARRVNPSLPPDLLKEGISDEKMGNKKFTLWIRE